MPSGPLPASPLSKSAGLPGSGALQSLHQILLVLQPVSPIPLGSFLCLGFKLLTSLTGDPILPTGHCSDSGQGLARCCACYRRLCLWDLPTLDFSQWFQLPLLLLLPAVIPFSGLQISTLTSSLSSMSWPTF